MTHCDNPGIRGRYRRRLTAGASRDDHEKSSRTGRDEMTSNKTTARGATWGGRPGRSNRMVTRQRVAAAILAIGAAAPILCTTSLASAATYDPRLDGYSMKAMTENIGATAFWDAGFTGAGVDVAVIDTGVAPVEGLATPDKIVNGPDLSLESQAPNLEHLDTNGHGTFIAGLIAGKDSDLQQPYSAASANQYRGVAPDARIVSVKVGTADGGVDVTQVIAAINWVVDHRHDNGMNIRVLNLSYGTNSTQPSLVDPLSYAAERAWKAGIVVVAAAGNTGYQRGAGAPGLADPAYNPYVLAVGGYDTRGTFNDSDDVVGPYSASSNVRGARKPDFVAVGTRLQGLRVPNSYIDANHSEGVARITLLPRHRYVGGGRSHIGHRCTGTPEVSEHDTRSGQGLSEGEGHRPVLRLFELAGRRGARPAETLVLDAQLVLDPGLCCGHRNRLRGAVSGPGSPHQGRGRPAGRDRHLRTALRPRNCRQQLVGRPVERFDLVRLQLVRLDLVRLDLVRLELVRLQLVRLQLVRLDVVRLQLVRLQLVGLQLVGLVLVWIIMVQRPLGLTLTPRRAPVSQRRLCDCGSCQGCLTPITKACTP